jgi:hypothetical protein
MNGDSGVNYGYGAYGAYGSASTITGFGGSGSTFMGAITITGQSANNIWCGSTLHINEYKNTNVWKSCLSRNSSSAETVFGCSTWSSTAAINSIQIFTNFADTYSIGSVFTLYGITAA